MAGTSFTFVAVEVTLDRKIHLWYIKTEMCFMQYQFKMAAVVADQRRFFDRSVTPTAFNDGDLETDLFLLRSQ